MAEFLFNRFEQCRKVTLNMPIGYLRKRPCPIRTAGFNFWNSMETIGMVAAHCSVTLLILMGLIAADSASRVRRSDAEILAEADARFESLAGRFSRNNPDPRSPN